MVDNAKITLSEKELSLACDAGWILTKQAITGKVYELFSLSIPAIKDALEHKRASIPPEAGSSHPRIFKGEQYLKLPYVMMDYPRVFNGNDIFAVRTMFWWGNFFSITFHLAGKYKSALEEKLLDNTFSAGKELFVAVNDRQWEHHFEQGNYLPVQQFSKQQLACLWKERDFIKLALKFKLEDWNKMAGLLQEGYLKISKVLD